MNAEDCLKALLFVVLTVPMLSFAVMAFGLLVARQLPERRIHQMLAWTLGLGLTATVLMLVVFPFVDADAVHLTLGSLLSVRGYALPLEFVVDAPGIVFLALDFMLVGLIGVMSSRYLHREPGYSRFFLLLLLFATGVAVIATARGLDLMFVGWELVGLSSALLIAFFYKREGPVEGGLRTFAIYRLTDIGLLTALVTLHHEAGTARFDEAFGGGMGAGAAVLVGGLLVFGAMGKGASVPFTGWLPRAMEGPTPSSAVFYGALSIHASPFLLLRIEPLLQAHGGLRAAVVAIGALTALHSAMVGRAQSDIKSTLAYASAAQVGLIWIEVGCGWSTLALVHLAGHAVLRTWQLIRSPSALADRMELQSLMGGNAGPGSLLLDKLPAGLRRRAWRMAVERWYLDDALDGIWLRARSLLRRLDRIDRAWARALGSQPKVPAGSLGVRAAEVAPLAPTPPEAAPSRERGEAR